MDLYFWESPEGNFGDDINSWLWPQVLPEIRRWSGQRESIFVGIGSLLNESLPEAPAKVIFSTGAGYYDSPPRPDDTWYTYAVRGPLTSKLLGLPGQAAVTDGAALVATLEVDSRERIHETSFVPHHRNASDGGRAWRRVCDRANLNYIDPREEVEEVLASLAGSRLVVAEAMHAAIVADALRVPWVPVRSQGIHAFKWRDWCRSLDLEYDPYWLPALYDRPSDESLPRRFYRDGKEKLAESRLRRIAPDGARFLSEERLLNNRIGQLRRRLEWLSADLHSAGPRRRGWRRP